jgi:periplasmic protein TonB
MAPSNMLEEGTKAAGVIESPPEKVSSSKPSVSVAERPPARQAVPPAKAHAELAMFKTSMMENNHIQSGSRTMDVLVAIAVHAVLIGTPILAGLFFTDTLNLRQFESTFLVAPPPPPPPPPAAAVVVRATPVHRVFENSGKLIAPTVVPKTIADIKEAPMPDSDFTGGVAGGVPGGVAGGSMGGVIGGVIGGMNSTIAAPLAPKENKPKAPIRVGGNIRAPKAIIRVSPEYPAIAKQTHISGTVTIDAVLDEQGNVQEMKIVGGPPMLYQAALDALRKWKYEPTYLNDQPVPVQLLVTITFQLNQ